jgi:hypothetical protein
MSGKARKFLSTVVPGVLKPLRVLWNEVIGFMFLAMAVIFGFSAWKNRGKLGGDFTSTLSMVLVVGFVLMLAGFGISSFLRARKIGRS